MNKNTLTDAVDKTALRIAIVETRPMFRKGLIGAFTEHWKNSSFLEFANIDELAKDSKPGYVDVVLIGLENGEDRHVSHQISSIGAKLPAAKIVLYDYQGNLKLIPNLLRLGIFGYLAADFDVSELRLCLNTVLEGKRYISNEIVWEYLNNASEPVSETKSRLSKMEEVVAGYLTQGMSVSRIAQTMNRQISTISTVKAKVFKKMKVANILDLKDRLQKDNISLEPA